jgi:precorrin-2 dehydrogenase / sirohydrochlorin ferrochelatase
LLIDLDLRRKRALVLGGGSEAELKVAKLVDAGASITVVAKSFTKGIRALSSDGDVRLIRADPGDSRHLLEELKPSVLFISTGRPGLDSELAQLGHSLGILLCVVDAPQHNDFNMPAISRIGAVRVAISTNGRSPAVAKMLRKRIEKLIRPEDLLQVELQGSLRTQIARTVKGHGERKRLVYEIIEDVETARLLKADDLRGAKRRASEIIREHRGSNNKS